jgi:hypothetical protein
MGGGEGNTKGTRREPSKRKCTIRSVRKNEYEEEKRRRTGRGLNHKKRKDMNVEEEQEQEEGKD